MLKTIIKRNGNHEEFVPEKLNKWARWSAEDLKDRVDWNSLVLETVRECPEEIESQQLQLKLIESCLAGKDWPHMLMAGRLFAPYLRKKLYGDAMPSVKKLHKKLIGLGLMRYLAYTEADYEEIEKIIDHRRDFKMTHFQLEYILHKYSLQDKVSLTKYETPQFIFMRMAMMLAETEPTERLMHLKKWYDHLSFNRINAPSPNYVNLGTLHNGLASCCLYAVGDTAKSLAIGDHIAYTMTYMSAGIGSNIICRSLGDPVRGGVISHMGKLPYFQSLAKAVRANMQGGRGGACTSYFSCYDPEVMTIIMLQNPKTAADKQNRDIHFAMLSNRLFAKKVAKNENIFVFNVKTAPDLHALFYSDKSDEFEALYERYELNPTFKKHYLNAREILIMAGKQGYEVSTLYAGNIDEINRHTSFKEPIYSSNLCMEICQPTKSYMEMMDLYSTEDHGRGEVSLCSLGGIVEPNIENDEQYADAAYYVLKMIDKCIDIADYELPHVGMTAKARRNAGVGLVGVATTLARNNLTYDSKAGLQKLHEIGERHAYHVISQSLRLGRELGNASWIHKTKWPDGWLPIDTYKKAVDELADPIYHYNWEDLRQRIIANKGIRHSSLIAHMPTESSSKASGVPNSLYPIRFLNIAKSDATSKIYWAAADSDLLSHAYQSAWDISEVDMIKAYAVIQKFADQAISADIYRDRTVKMEVTTEEIIQTYLARVKYGVKTQYYTNSKTSDMDEYDAAASRGCVGGACTL